MSLNFERQAFYLMASDEADRPPAEDAVVGIIEGIQTSIGDRSFGAASFPDEETDEDSSDESDERQYLNGGTDVGH